MSVLAAEGHHVPVVDPSAAGSMALPLVLVIALPAFGAAVLLLGGRLTDKWGHLLGCVTVAASFVCSLILFITILGRDASDRQVSLDLWTWFSTGDWKVQFGLLYDPLSALFLLLITGVGGLIHVYSIGYMEHDERRRRFFGYLNLFVAAMLMLVLASDYVGVFLGWEGVGLASYLLIGFWQYKPTAAAAAKKAFVINRVGDIGLSLGVGLIFATFGTTSFAQVSELTSGASGGVMTAIGLLLLLAACGKSAQFPLQTWLLDAMEGPTPVSALIHAATMVTAGVYLIVRSQFIFEYTADARLAVAVVGTITLLMGAWIGCAKDDIKKVLAGSTMSQIGYMVLAAGMGVAGYAFAIFHLLMHGFFKANMFLGAGSVMHGTNDDVNMRHYGALRKADAGHLPDLHDGLPRDHRVPRVRRVLVEGQDHRGRADPEHLARPLRTRRCRRHRFLHDPVDADDVLRQGALGEGRPPARVAEGDDHPADGARRPVAPRRPAAAQRLDRQLPLAGHRRRPARGTAAPGGRDQPDRPRRRRRRRRDRLDGLRAAATCPRVAPTKVSVFTTAGRNELYGDAFNDEFIVRPGKRFNVGLAAFDSGFVDGGAMGTASAFRGISSRLRLVQNGFVRSYALGLLGGAALVLLALLVVNLG